MHFHKVYVAISSRVLELEMNANNDLLHIQHTFLLAQGNL